MIGFTGTYTSDTRGFGIKLATNAGTNTPGFPAN